ncbi:MAG: HD domain-containing protein [Candidatus Omnitrophota bacterium]|nr:MAG: HD domain-containing protein [Candidatus Omnitrophota bacterium]
MNLSVFLIPPFLTGLCALVMGLFVLLKNRASPLNRSFSILCFTAMAWQFGNVMCWSSQNPQISLLWAKFVYCGIAFSPAAVYHMSVEFNKFQKQKSWIPFAYIASCVLLLLVFRDDFILSSYEVPWGKHVLVGKSHDVFLPFWFLPLVFALANFYYGYQSADSPFEKQRRRFLLISFLIVCTASVDYLPNYGFPIRPMPLGFIPLIFFVIATTYAIIHYRILDIDIILKRVSIILFLFVIAVMLIHIIPFYLQPYLYQLWGRRWILFPISIAFLIGLVILRIIAFIRQIEEEKLSQKFSYRPIMRKEAERISIARSVNELLAYATRDLSSWVRLEYVGILVVDNHTKEFILRRSLNRTKNRRRIPLGITISPNNPLVIELLRKRTPLVRREMEYELDTKVVLAEEREFLTRITEQMQRLGAEISIPSFCEGKLLAIINIGHKFNPNDIITNEDLELFASLSNHIGRAIHDFMLKEERIQLIVASQNILITAIEARDQYTRGHTDRVARYAVLIGEKLEKQLRPYPNGLTNLKWAAQLHDIGKIGISDKILLKEGGLNDEEWQKIKEHAMNGLKIISPMREWLGEDICAAVLHHHENLDGSGYPSQQKGEEIHLFARIIRVADSFDAMITTRPYRAALTKEEAIKELKKYKGKYYDSHIVNAMVRLYNEGKI